MRKISRSPVLVRSLFAILACAACIQVQASDGKDNMPAAVKEPLSDKLLLSKLNIIAIPIGPKGMVIKDDKGCMWMISNTDDGPKLHAVIGEEEKAPLCDGENLGH